MMTLMLCVAMGISLLGNAAFIAASLLPRRR